MPQLGGVFNLFPDLDTITASDIVAFSNQKFEHHFVENHLANRILYPQSVALTKQELDLDFFILSLALNKHPEVFFDKVQNRIIIPKIAITYFPPLTRLVSVILLNIPDDKITELWLKNADQQQIIGSCIPRTFIQSLNLTGDIKVEIQNQVKTLIPNQLNLIPVNEKMTKVKFDDRHSYDVLGGSLGLFFDLREEKV